MSDHRNRTPHTLEEAFGHGARLSIPRRRRHGWAWALGLLLALVLAALFI